jgi:hypothetical protein
MKDNPYAAHWVDSVIRKAHSLMEVGGRGI